MEPGIEPILLAGYPAVLRACHFSLLSPSSWLLSVTETDWIFWIIPNVDIGDLMFHMVCHFGLCKFQLTLMSNCKSLCNDPLPQLSYFLTDNSTKWIIRKALIHISFLWALVVSHYLFPLIQANESFTHFCSTAGFFRWLYSLVIAPLRHYPTPYII